MLTSSIFKVINPLLAFYTIYLRNVAYQNDLFCGVSGIFFLEPLIVGEKLLDFIKLQGKIIIPGTF